ncbi:MAG: hypothetical protein EB084_07475 [Proteobacteria bacterium]|nr:hypothetical protein [Pseudomonadota bacterium]
MNNIASSASPHPLRYISPSSAEFYGLTDSSTTTMPAEPSDSRHQRAIDALLNAGVSPEARTRCRQILSVYPAGTLEALKKSGLTFEITKGQAVQGVSASGNVALGGYSPLERRIVFDEAVLMSNIGRHVVTHEMVHALDHMRGDRMKGNGLLDRFKSNGMLASTKDSELASIYARYLARGAVEAVGQIRANLKAEHGALPPSATINIEDNWGAMSVEYRQEGEQEVFRIEQQPRTAESDIQERMREKATGSAGARRLPPTEVDVELARGGTAHVRQEGTVSTITMPKSGANFTGDIWSDYAHRSCLPEEYVAEAFSHYLQGGSKRDEMQFVDPDMLAYTERVLTDEFNLHP